MHNCICECLLEYPNLTTWLQYIDGCACFVFILWQSWIIAELDIEFIEHWSFKFMPHQAAKLSLNLFAAVLVSQWSHPYTTKTSARKTKLIKYKVVTINMNTINLDLNSQISQVQCALSCNIVYICYKFVNVSLPH